MPALLRRPLPSRLLILGPAVMVLVLALLLYASARQLERQTARVENTYRVLLAQEEVLQRLLEAQTGARGYLMSGDSSYLQAHRTGVEGVRVELARLGEQMVAKPAQQARVAVLAEAVEAKLSVIDRQIAARRDGGLAAGLPLLALGRPEMDRVLSAGAVIRAEEQQLLAERRRAQERQLGLIGLLAGLGALLGGGASLLAGRRLGQHVEAERRAGAELEDANQRLREQAAQLQRQADEMAEQARTLRERDTRLRRIADANMVGVIFWTLDGPVTYANDAFLELVGYTREDLEQGRVDWRSITPPEWAPVDDHAIQMVGQFGVARAFEKEYRHRNGHRVPVLLSAALFEESTQEGVTLVVDLSARKAAERALAEEAELRRIAIESAHMGTWEMDVTTGETIWDRRAQEIVGRLVEGPITQEEAIASIHPEDRGRAVEQARVLSGPEAAHEYHAEKRIVRPDGKVRWTYWSGRMRPGTAPGSYRVVGTVQDVTERREAEEALRRSEQTFRRLAESIPQLVWTSRADGQVEYVNERWNEYTGIHSDEAIGEAWLAALHPEDRERALTAWEASVLSGETYEAEYRLRRHDGEFRWFLGRARPLRSEDGEIVRWFGTLTDIDEQKRTRDELQRLYREVEEANRTKAEFLATMSHELRTPLNAILGYADLLEMGVPQPLEPGALRYVQRIVLSARHQHQLIEEILAFNRLEAGKETVNIEAVSLPGLLDEVSAVMAPLAERKALTLYADASAAPEPLSTDPRKLRQILLNLLGNAVKFTASGHVALRMEQGEHCARFVVEDTGLGICPEEQQKIFEPFWQADRSLTREVEGTGLGLAISRRYAHLLGGEILVESEPGGGSRFTLVLPRTPGEQGAARCREALGLEQRGGSDRRQEDHPVAAADVPAER
jgi:PAS domain S-box-containing protein